MIIENVIVGMLHTNCWILADDQTRDAVLFDPGSHLEKILARLEEQDLHLKKIVLTHGHFDHVMAARLLQEATGAETMICQLDDRLLEPEVIQHRGYMRQPYERPVIHRYIGEGDSFDCGSLHFEVIRTPGHTLGSICLLCGDVMIAGDTLFDGACGRWDLESGSEQDMMNTLRRLHDLPGDYKVLPGHGTCTTLERERQTNPYMRGAVRG